MKILFVCHRFPFPPSRGGKIRPFHMIRHLHAAGHDVTVAAPHRSPGELEAGAGLADFCAEILTGRASPGACVARMLAYLPTSQPSSPGYFYARTLHEAVGERLATRRFDLILVHCSTAAQYVPEATETPRILDFGDMDSQKWRLYGRHRRFPMSVGYALEGVKLERHERDLAGRFDLCTCTTAAELETLRAIGGARASALVPNGVDAERFAPRAEPYDPQLLCFVGRMDYYPNQRAVSAFCRNVWPQLRRLRHDLRFVIVGASPSRGVQRLARIDGVSVTDTVPDTRPYFARAAVSLAPLEIARGTQNKILEAMAMGTPVVASRVAARGVDAVPGEHLLVADTTDELLAAVGRLLDDPATRRTIARAARERVLSHHGWQAAMGKLDELIERVVPSSAGSRSAGVDG